MDAFSNFDLSDSDLPSFDAQRLGMEWATVNAFREMLGIALKGSTTPTYAQSLAFSKSVAPKIFDTDQSLIGKVKERELVQEYRQKTKALSQIENRKISDTEIIDRDIKELDEYIRVAHEDDQLIKHMYILQTTRLLLQIKNYTETQLILRDLFKAKRNLPAPPIGLKLEKLS